jgi:hypothetical protein
MFGVAGAPPRLTQGQPEQGEPQGHDATEGGERGLRGHYHISLESSCLAGSTLAA